MHWQTSVPMLGWSSWKTMGMLIKVPHAVTITAMLVLAGCGETRTFDTSTDSIRSSDSGEGVSDCQNTFTVTPMPDQQLTEYGTEVLKIESSLPDLLSETGLYSNIETKEIHPAVHWFKPAYELWSDGEDKNRWVYIPECAKIDSSNMNDWSFPVGTRFYKEFSADGVRVETRYVERMGLGKRDFAFVSYLWNEEQTEAYKVGSEGLPNVLDTNHDIPSREQCFECHGTSPKGGGRPSRGLGFSAIMLSEASTGLSLETLVDNDMLSHPPTHSISIPGDQFTQDALGYLHINCGTCHNQSEDGLPQFDMNLWLDVETDTPENSNTWQTTVNVDTQIFKDQHVLGRVVPGNPTASAVLYRMTHRSDVAQMPPIATKEVDTQGSQIITQWIESLP